MAVYFIRPIGMRGPVKIGCAEFPPVRLKTLMTWSPFPLEIVATIHPGDTALERRLHGIFAASHTRREWFAITPELETLIDRLVAGEALGDLIDFGAPVLPFRATNKDYMTPEWRRRASYQGRVRWAFSPLWTPGDDALFEPRDVTAIMDRWSMRGGRPGTPPTPTELRRLEEVIADPRAHAVPWRVRYPEISVPRRAAQQGAAA